MRKKQPIPRQAKWAINYTASACDSAHLPPAKDSFCNIAKKRAKKEQPEQFVKSTSCCKYTSHFLCFFSSLQFTSDDFLDFETSWLFQDVLTPSQSDHFPCNLQLFVSYQLLLLQGLVFLIVPGGYVHSEFLKQFR